MKECCFVLRCMYVCMYACIIHCDACTCSTSSTTLLTLFKVNSCMGFLPFLASDIVNLSSINSVKRGYQKKETCAWGFGHSQAQDRTCLAEFFYIHNCIIYLSVTGLVSKTLNLLWSFRGRRDIGRFARPLWKHMHAIFMCTCTRIHAYTDSAIHMHSVTSKIHIQNTKKHTHTHILTCERAWLLHSTRHPYPL